MNLPMSGSVKTIKQLAAEYKVHPNTLRRWVNPIADKLKLSRYPRTLLPWQIKMIYEFLDYPENFKEI
jgi:transposase-like protein